ncbi:MAG: DNA/RNA nuclease SfsA [Pseudomonadota bacterium]
MKFDPPLIQGILIRRYKRFLVDVELTSGERVTAHCPNTGSMRNCLFPGQPVWLSNSQNPKRKYSLTWELAQTPDNQWIIVNTHRANQLVAEALDQSQLKEFPPSVRYSREVRLENHASRIDFVLETSTKTFMEVKSVTLLEQNNIGTFPDAVTTRGQKHLQELMLLKQQGFEAVMFYCINHSGIEEVTVAEHIDSTYAKQLYQAMQRGIKILCYKTEISPQGISIDKPLNFISLYKP